MSRTYRHIASVYLSHGKRIYRRPKTTSERAQLINLISDINDEGFMLSGANRVNVRASTLPNYYDDVVKASVLDMADCHWTHPPPLC